MLCWTLVGLFVFGFAKNKHTHAQTHTRVKNHDLSHITCSHANTCSRCEAIKLVHTSLERRSHDRHGRAHANKCGEAHQTVTAICEARSCQICPRELLTGTHELSLMIQHKSRARSSAHTQLHQTHITYTGMDAFIQQKQNKYGHTQLQAQTFSLRLPHANQTLSSEHCPRPARVILTVKSNLPHLTW